MEDNQELYDLKAKVNKIEYTEIKELKDEVQQVKIDLNTNNILTKQCIESNDKIIEVNDIMIISKENLNSKIKLELFASVIEDITKIIEIKEDNKIIRTK